MKELLLISVFGLCYVYVSSAQHILTLGEGTDSPEATIEQLAWLEGHWGGNAMGGTVEEIWAAPKAGAMMGMFRAERNGEISFYEFFTVQEIEGSLVLQIKHFQRDLVGWEEKDETVDFPLVKLEDRSVWFDGLTMIMTEDDKLTVYVQSEHRDGSVSELVFPYRKIQ